MNDLFKTFMIGSATIITIIVAVLLIDRIPFIEDILTVLLVAALWTIAAVGIGFIVRILFSK